MRCYNFTIQLGVAARCAEVAAPSTFEVGDAPTVRRGLAQFLALLETGHSPSRAGQIYLPGAGVARGFGANLLPGAYQTCYIHILTEI